ncbi:MAG: cell division protein FtsZ [Bacteroidales bacterium]|nr:cell division protein FtsZ [Bacteroidales bacterium]
MNEERYTFDLPDEEPRIIKVIGVGGGGSNAVNHMYQEGIQGVSFVVCNTDNQALQNSPVSTRIQLGRTLTFGRGAGNEPMMGREAALESIEEIRQVLSGGTKMVFLTAGMGGGTGTGAAPVIAELSREMDILTVGIVTLPFSFEGEKRWNQAIEGIRELKDRVDALLIIHNDRLREIYGDQKLSVAFGYADNVLTMAAKGIAEIITVPGYVNVDYADVRTVMDSSGVAIMGAATASGEQRARQAIESALVSPLLNNNNLKGAKNILLNVISGTQEVLMDEITEIMDFVRQCTGIESDIIWGNTFDESLGDALSVTIVATGLKEEIGIGELKPDYRNKKKFIINDEGKAEEVSDEEMPESPEKSEIPFEVDGRETEPQLTLRETDLEPEPAPVRRRKKQKEKSRGWIQTTLGDLFDSNDTKMK